MSEFDPYFDPYHGYSMPSDFPKSETRPSLKEIIAELNHNGDPESSIYREVERVLYVYKVFVSEGIREQIASHKDVSWYLTDGDDERAFINYQDGMRAEWARECMADEVPLWLLMGLLQRIQRRKPLGDQETNEIISKVNDLDAEHVREAAKHDLETLFMSKSRGRP